MGDERILIVDDDPSVAEVCAEILAETGYQVRGAGGGQEALTCLAGEQFDLLLLDLKMPGVDGLTVLRRARELDPGVTAVIVTSYGTIENAIEALQAGARDFLLKPFEPDDLLLAVDKALAARRREQENRLLQAQLPLLKISQALMTEGDMASLAGPLLEVVVQQIGAERASLLLLDEEADELYVAGAIGLPAEGLGSTRLPAGEGLAGQALLREKPLLLDAQSRASLDPLMQALMIGPDTAVVCVPLRGRKKTLGLLSLSRAEQAGGTPFTRADLGLLSLLAGQIAIALENTQLLETVRAGREQARRLTRQIVSAQEEERQRLSRELHDEAGQALTVLKISLDMIQADLPPELRSLRQRLRAAVDLTDTTMERIRMLAQDLRPPSLNAVGLNPTLEGLCQDFAERTHLAVDYIGADLPLLPDAISIGLYRLLQEALTNVAKHARASRVYVALRCDAQEVSLSVADDGQGFDRRAGLSGGIGLLGMQERLVLLGGWLEIESHPGQGTRLVTHVPWQEVGSA